MQTRATEQPGLPRREPEQQNPPGARVVLTSMAKTLGYMAGFAVLHSALATETSKRLVARWIGETQAGRVLPICIQRGGRAHHGGAGNAHSAAAGQNFLRPARRRPRAHRDTAGVRARHDSACGGAGGHRPVFRPAGAAGLRSAAEAPTLPPPQGVPPSIARGLALGGPYRFTRHPLNFATVVVVFASARMSAVRLSVGLATLAYALIGSKLEEHRLLDRYGQDYREYVASGVPFFWPRLPR